MTQNVCLSMSNSLAKLIFKTRQGFRRKFGKSDVLLRKEIDRQFYIIKSVTNLQI